MDDNPSDMPGPAGVGGPVTDDTHEGVAMVDDAELLERIHKLEVEQATQAATAAGAQATQAATQAGATATGAASVAGLASAVAAGAAGLIIGIFLGMAIAKSRT